MKELEIVFQDSQSEKVSAVSTVICCILWAVLGYFLSPNFCKCDPNN